MADVPLNARGVRFRMIQIACSFRQFCWLFVSLATWCPAPWRCAMADYYLGSNQLIYNKRVLLVLPMKHEEYVHLFPVVVLIVASIFIACRNTTIINSEGILTSPGYDGRSKYDSDLNHCWKIEAPQGQVQTNGIITLLYHNNTRKIQRQQTRL